MRWREANGRHTKISSMETRHLFYTLRLIWNNQYGKTHRWNRGPIRPFTHPHYTEGYLKDVNYQMHKELLRRKKPAWMESALDDLKVLKLELLLECP